MHSLNELNMNEINGEQQHPAMKKHVTIIKTEN